MTQFLLIFAAVLQGLAVAYAFLLLVRRSGAASAWLFLLGAMLSMLAWRIVVAVGIEPPAYFNPLIAIWGSTCMFAAMFLFGREVGRREQAEAERDHLLTSERAARSEAERANRLKDEFLASLSHELRTPLAVILGWCTILQKAAGDRDRIERGLETIERNARIQTRLVDDMLDVARIGAGTLRLEVRDLPLDQPVRAALEDARPEAEAKGLTLTLDCVRSPVVCGDAARLQQLVANLLTNAIKFTPQGGTVSATLDEHDGCARLVISDSGEGIAAEFLPHVFERFRQQDSSKQRRHGGLGLGLAIVSDLVRMHEGKVSASSEGAGKGATFTVTLPLAPATDASPGAGGACGDAVVNDASGQNSVSGMRIVVIDDEEDVRTTVSLLLGQMGAEVVALESGSNIEEVLRLERPDVLLIDIGMPQEDGYSLLRRIRRLPAANGSGVPAISLTAFARDVDRERALDSGFQEHLTKPIDVPRLARAIAQVRKPRAVSA